VARPNTIEAPRDQVEARPRERVSTRASRWSTRIGSPTRPSTGCCTTSPGWRSPWCTQTRAPLQFVRRQSSAGLAEAQRTEIGKRPGKPFRLSFAIHIATWLMSAHEPWR